MVLSSGGAILFDGIEGMARGRFVLILGGGFLPTTLFYSSSTREEMKSPSAVVLVMLETRLRSIPVPKLLLLNERSVSAGFGDCLAV